MSTNLTRSIVLPLTGAVIAYAGSKMLYGTDLAIPSSYGDIDLALAMGVAAGLGLGISEFAHDYIFKTIHISEKLANPATIAVNTGINFGAQVGLMSMLNPTALGDVDKVKLAGTSIAVVIGADYVYNNFVGPMLGDESHAQFSS